MSFSNNDGMVMPVGPMYSSGSDGFGFGGNGAWWIILFLFAMWGGWGNNSFGNQNGGVLPYLMNGQTQSDIARGFDTAGLTSQLSGIQNAITSGFSAAEVNACNRELSAQAQNNNIAMALQNCCCENRANVADLKYTVATENCADRAALSEAINNLITANAASTQKILDQMCSDKIDAKNEKIAELQNQLSMAQLAASQTAQTAQILADNSRQTSVLEDYLNPVPRPAYIVQNPNGCGCQSACGF